LKKIVAIAAILVGLNFVIPSTATAASSKPAPPPSGITLSPASQQVTLPGAEAQHRLEFIITNNETKPQTLNIATADFNTLGESGGLVFVGTNPSQLQKKYGLATWLTIPQNIVTVQPKQTLTITAFVLNQPSMSPGGHYGALMLGLSTANSSGTQKGKNNVALHPIASSLIFVNKTGGDTHVLKLTDVYVDHNPFKLPNSVTLRFRNDGNTHLTPRGIVTITSPGGKLISKGIINENSGLVLPETYRRFSVPLNKISSPLRPGNYTLRVDFRFEGYDQFRSYQTKLFLLTPIKAIVFVLIIASVCCAGYVLSKNKQIRKFFVNMKKRLQKN
jgi:hypothetical protein